MTKRILGRYFRAPKHAENCANPLAWPERRYGKRDGNWFCPSCGARYPSQLTKGQKL